jgi:hypothetical protein
MSVENASPGPSTSKSGKWLLLGLLIAAIVGCFYGLAHEHALGGGRALHYGLRVITVALALVGWFWSQALIGSRGLKDGVITDGFHELSAPLHAYLMRNPKLANTVLIVSSAFIDLFGLFLIAAGIFGPTLRPFVSLLILFIFRQICQAVCALPAPKDMIWRNPGFPSLLVTYGTATDFFFSGHTAVAVLGAIEIVHLCPWWVGMVAGVIAFLEASVVVVLRAHYTMDIFGAAVAAWCAASLGGWVCAWM